MPLALIGGDGLALRHRIRLATCAIALAACASADRTVGPKQPPPPPDTSSVQPPAVQRVAGAPVGWYTINASAGFTLGTITGLSHGGTNAVYVSRPVTAPPTTLRFAGARAPSDPTFASMAQTVRADGYRGRRVRWSGWVRATDVEGWAGLWMRVDGPGVMQAFDNMNTRAVVGSIDWQQFSVVLEVPANAIGIALGVLMNGTGEVLADDFALESVDSSVAVTDLLSSPQPSSDSATIASWYARAPGRPRNLDFEGLADETALAAAWLAGAAVPLATAEPEADLTDLEPLRGMIGTARIVGMGEATHGTHEFFQLKRRVFEYLVREMGFTHFAIEATWPEANDVNRYVLTGQGDPRRLLSWLYFWTWNTQEVLDLIEWMRAWNTTASVDRRVRFVGFDMQSPGFAMDTVASFVGRVDAPNAQYVADRYACLRRYRNYGPAAPAKTSDYAALSPGERQACRQALLEVYQLLSANRDAYRSASSDEVYANALQSARVVQQWEEMAAQTSSVEIGRVRDRSMAENAGWLLQQGGPSARMMVWAHNLHVVNQTDRMGAALRSAFGEDYVNLGFVFGTGAFNAVEQNGSTFGYLKAWSTGVVPDGSIESIFMATGRPLLLFDTRRIAAGGSAAALLGGPLLMRSIGATFSPAWESYYFQSQVFPADFQLLLFVRSTTPSTLLSFVYLSSPP
jgi:erythromycin esterase